MTDLAGPVTAQLEAVILAVPGVARLYRTSVLADTITATAARIVPALQGNGSWVRADEGVVTVTVATEPDAAAPQVAHDVHDAIAAHMIAQALPFVRADITIARIG